MYLSPYQRLAASVLGLALIGMGAGCIMALADATIHYRSMAIAFSIAIISGVLVATAWNWQVYTSAANYGRWLLLGAVPIGFSAAGVGLLAWLLAQRWESLTAGTSDQYIVSMGVFGYLAGATFSTIIQSAFVLEFDHPCRMIRPWTREAEQPAYPELYSQEQADLDRMDEALEDQFRPRRGPTELPTSRR